MKRNYLKNFSLALALFMFMTIIGINTETFASAGKTIQNGDKVYSADVNSGTPTRYSVNNKNAQTIYYPTRYRNVFPIYLKKGTVFFKYMTDKRQASDQYSTLYFADTKPNDFAQNSAHPWLTMITDNGKGGVNTDYSKVAKTGTYYIETASSKPVAFEVSNYPTEGTINLKKKSSSLYSGSILCAGLGTSNYTYYKITVPSAGYLNISCKGNLGTTPMTLRTQITDKTKSKLYVKTYREISEKDTFKLGHGKYFALKAGTYYLKVSTDKAAYRLTADFNKVKPSKTGLSKKKAPKLKRKVKVKGILPINNRTSNWYKIKQTKKRRTVKIFYSPKFNTFDVRMKDPNTSITIYKGKKVIAKRKFYYSKPVKIKLNRLKRGTYYIKVGRAKDVSAFYTLFWK